MIEERHKGKGISWCGSCQPYRVECRLRKWKVVTYARTNLPPLLRSPLIGAAVVMATRAKTGDLHFYCLVKVRFFADGNLLFIDLKEKGKRKRKIKKVFFHGGSQEHLK